LLSGRLLTIAIGIGIELAALNVARAEPPPVPWAITGTSSVSEPAAPEVGHLVEHRAFEKAGRFAARAGVSWLARSDLRSNPGISVDLAWYAKESLSIEFLSATAFFSELDSTAEELRRSTGLLPDSQKPIARVTTGARFSFAYGKLLIEDADTVVHLDASAAAHIGALVTDVAPNASTDLDLAFQVGLGSHLVLWLEGGWLVSYERRTTSDISTGFLASAGFGVLL
jgi:hypothetical protein